MLNTPFECKVSHSLQYPLVGELGDFARKNTSQHVILVPLNMIKIYIIFIFWNFEHHETTQSI